jgi:hypothetical protein
MTQAAQQRLLDILEYWHKIEFFIPFDLNQITDTEDKWKLRWLTRDDLASLPTTYFSTLAVPPERKLTGYRLFIGIFDKAEILKSCAISLSASQPCEEEERTEMEGRTCCARLALNACGEPNFDPVSVSTVPWALGRVMAQGLSSLGLDAFDAGREGLKDRLQNFISQRAPAPKSGDGTVTAAPLSGAEMGRLTDLFAEWSGFFPDRQQPAILLEIVTTENAAPPLETADAAAVPEDADDSDEVEEAAEPGIDILNSFYIEDIECAMRAVRNGEPVPLLDAYLNPLAQNQRVDVYTDAGRAELWRLLHPAFGNRGHWLEDADRRMSLMQQFAINAGMAKLAERGLFAVNGPPGTGKTTLLREVFAENIVRRAGVLARLNHAADAFTGKVRVGFANTDETTTIGCLHADLTGFEMVVASSNNAAVENISRDLPKSKQLGAAWKDFSYLRPVAHRLAAEDDKGKVAELSEDEAPWGLISCALGNSSNRRRFVSKFYYANKEGKGSSDRRCQHIRDWVEKYNGPGFSQAAADYLVAERHVDQLRADLARYADLRTAMLGQDAALFCREQQLAAAAADDVAAATPEVLRNSPAALSVLTEHLADLSENERLLDRSRPGFWSRLLRTGTARRHQSDVMRNADAQLAARFNIAAAKRHEADCVTHSVQAAAAAAQAESNLAARWRQWEQLSSELAALAARFVEPVPASLDALEMGDVQIAGLWHDGALAALRATLFAKALALHEAWLADVASKGGGFGGNLFAIAKLLDGRRPEVSTHGALIWQSLFMVVPVVSTTFASFARQFRDMGGRSLGWLFIDEAGQAVPQAAVGALWRARRAVVVGDPRQIEPVFTVPMNLIRALSALSAHTAGDDYAPDKVSVQRLADAANCYGTLAPEPGTSGLWIGSPLRVHRRCADPMFSLSNSTAYGGKMVFGLKSRQPPAGLRLGESGWIQIQGATTFKQVVPQQIDYMTEVVLRLYARDGELPPLYCISPFKAVKNELKKSIMAIDWARHVPGRKTPKKKVLRTWCKERVGTVHTFQGKEQGTVFMLLGVDADRAGAAAWAASKPNLLNVALTRAQHHFYMVGDIAVWRGLRYFSDASATLPLIDARQFAGRIA